jgi:hypothetical protein
MKKSRILLGSIALLALGSGLFAFKVQSTQSLFFTGTNVNVCNVQVLMRTGLPVAVGQMPLGTRAFAENSGPCTTTTVYYLGN